MSDDWTDYRAKANPFELSGRLTPEYSSYLETLENRVRREPKLSQDDIEDLGHNELIFDREFLIDLNRQIRSHQARWLATDVEDSSWPDDLLIIGGFGCGDYYCISSSGAFTGIQLYEHEVGRFVHVANDFDSYYETIMSDVRKERELDQRLLNTSAN